MLVNGLWIEVLPDRHVSVRFPAQPYDVEVPFTVLYCHYADSFAATMKLSFAAAPKASFATRNTHRGACISISGRGSGDTEWLGYATVLSLLGWTIMRRRARRGVDR